jgi:hypothetical protein
MLAVRDHRAHDYAVLKDMDLTDVGILDDSDHACLREIGEYLTIADAWRRFAIWLLHKHIEPLAGEIFVERAMPRTGTTETTPMQRSAFAFDSLSASAIRFGDDIDTDLYLVGLEFSELSSFGDVAPLSADDNAVLVGIAQRLRSHGKIDRFGVKLIRNPLGLPRASSFSRHATRPPERNTAKSAPTKRFPTIAQSSRRPGVGS